MVALREVSTLGIPLNLLQAGPHSFAGCLKGEQGLNLRLGALGSGPCLLRLLVDLAHKGGRLLDRRLGPEITGGVYRPVFLYFDPFVIDQ